MGLRRDRFNCLASIAAVGCALLSAIVAQPAAALELKAGYALSNDSHWGAAANAFAAKLDELSKGGITVAQYPDGQLGNERAMVEGLQIGTIDVVFTSTGPVGNFVKDVQLFDLPFLFRDLSHARAVQDGPVGQSLLEKFPAANLIALAWGDAGFRHVTNNKRDIRKPADMAGLKIRTMENDAHILAFRTLGALPTPMAFTELYTSLQNGTLDGQENPVAVIISGKLYEVQSRLSLTGHALTNALILISPSVWDGLSDEQKGWMREAAAAGKQALRARIDADEAEGRDFLSKHGVSMVGDVDRAAFRAALEPAYQVYRQQFGTQLIDQIVDTK